MANLEYFANTCETLYLTETHRQERQCRALQKRVTESEPNGDSRDHKSDKRKEYYTFY